MYMPLLEIDLTTGSVGALELPRELREEWIGGPGLGFYLLSRELRRDLRPTDPDCPVYVLTGPLTGTSVPQSSDWCIVSVNPEFPKNICASHAHGDFGARLRHAGWDGVVVRGQAEEPVYLWIDDGEPELRPADELWGLDTFETQRVLLAKHDRPGRPVSIACIGQAGENLVEGASVRADWAYGANQGGAGVLWGSKRLKAIAVCGTRPVAVRDPERLDALAEEWQAQIAATYPGFPEPNNYDGLKYMTGMLKDLGMIPAKNFTDPEFGVRWSERLASEMEKWQIEPVGSWNCKAECHFRAKCTTGPMAGIEFSGYGGEVMEETGPNLGIEDPGIAFVLGGMIDGYGMAAKAAPRTIAMLMEAFEAGAIGLDETGGLDLSWGNHDSVFRLLEMTIERKGLGELIAQGLRPTAKALGIEEYAVHMHGVGFNDHEQRATPMNLFQSQVASGAGPTWQTIPTVMMGWPDPDLGFEQGYQPGELDHVAEATHGTQKAKLFNDALGVCFFAQMAVAGSSRFQTGCLEAATGVSLTPDEAFAVGERIVALQRLLTVYLGYTPDDDFDMSQRLFEKLASGPATGRGFTREEFSCVRDEFYELQGWSLTTGAPTEESLARLGLSGFAVGADQPG